MRASGRRLPCGLMVLASALLGVACATAPRQGEVNLITVDQELKLGALCAKEVMSTFPQLSDSEVVRYIGDMGTRLATHSDWSGLRFSFRVIDSPEVYSFALPGGHVFVSRGMVECAGTAAQLAGVLAHEIAHVVDRHGAERVTRRYGLALVSESLLGPNPAIGRAIVAELHTANGILAYGHEAEKAADALALRYMHRAGYQPQALVALVERLKALEQERPGLMARWRTTHQPAKVRLQRLKKELKQIPPGEDLVEDEAQFHALKERLGSQAK